MHKVIIQYLFQIKINSSSSLKRTVRNGLYDASALTMIPLVVKVVKDGPFNRQNFLKEMEMTILKKPSKKNGSWRWIYIFLLSPFFTAIGPLLRDLSKSMVCLVYILLRPLQIKFKDTLPVNFSKGNQPFWFFF